MKTLATKTAESTILYLLLFEKKLRRKLRNKKPIQIFPTCTHIGDFNSLSKCRLLRRLQTFSTIP
jgi:hypothetical protein